jgi:prepilin-type N-terminal cleavage/methylation domain-containing protein
MNTHTQKHKKAFTLVELLLSLAILGMLMAAVAFAFDASVTNYQANEGIYRTVNTGRQVLLRITNDVRRPKAGPPNPRIPPGVDPAHRPPAD